MEVLMARELSLQNLLDRAKEIEINLRKADLYFVERGNHKAQDESRKRAVRQIDDIIANKISEENKSNMIWYLQWHNKGLVLDWLTNLRIIRVLFHNFKSLTCDLLRNEVEKARAEHSIIEKERRSTLASEEAKGDEILAAFGNLPETIEEREREIKSKAILSEAWERQIGNRGMASHCDLSQENSCDTNTERSPDAGAPIKYNKTDSARVVILLAKELTGEKFYPRSTTRDPRIGNYQWAKAWDSVAKKMKMPDCILKHWPNKKAFVDGARKALKNNHDELSWQDLSRSLKVSDLLEKQR
jgi:hypothetical protein